MTLQQWILKTRRQALWIMVAFLDLIIIGLLAVTSLFVLTFSLKFFLVFLGAIAIFSVLFVIFYIPAIKLDNKYKALYKNGYAIFIQSKTTKEFKNEVFVRTQNTLNGTMYIKENHQPVHKAFV